MSRSPPAGFGHGDRVVWLGTGQGRGKHADVLSVRRDCTAVRFDDGAAMWVLTAECHPIPRRPPPMW